MNFVGPGTRLADTDLPRLGSLIGVGEDELHAFLEVETTGSGFDELKRPKILFEYHVFYRNLPASARELAIEKKLATKSQGMLPYGKSSEQYPRLMQALVINETAALKACSWGIGQVLGENCVAAGFQTVQEMVSALVESEAAQLLASINLIKSNHLDDELRSHNWTAFARGYNGAGYAKFTYDTKLSAAYAKWAKIRDTPWPLQPLQETLAQAVRTPGAHPVVSLPKPVPVVPYAAPVPAAKPAPGFWSRFWASFKGKPA